MSCDEREQKTFSKLRLIFSKRSCNVIQYLNNIIQHVIEKCWNINIIQIVSETFKYAENNTNNFSKTFVLYSFFVSSLHYLKCYLHNLN